jgi:hypothetical protein
MQEFTTTQNTVADQVREAFDFSVDRLPLSGPDNMPTDHYGLFRSDNAECTGRTVKKGYIPHQTEDVQAIVDAASTVFEGGGDTDVQCHWRDGHHVTVSPSRDIRKSLFGGKDNVFPRLIIHAGYDGTAFSATLGMFRDVCSNLQMLRHVSGTTTKIRHTSGLRGHMDELIEDFRTLESGWEAVGQYIDRMSETTIALDQFLEHLYPLPSPEASANTVTRHRNTITSITRRVLREYQQTGQQWGGLDGAPSRVSAWMAYNGATGFLEHDKTRKGERNRSSADRSILAMADPISTKADSYIHSLITA